MGGGGGGGGWLLWRGGSGGFGSWGAAGRGRGTWGRGAWRGEGGCGSRILGAGGRVGVGRGEVMGLEALLVVGGGSLWRGLGWWGMGMCAVAVRIR